jgi:hypothetical protein
MMCSVSRGGYHNGKPAPKGQEYLHEQKDRILERNTGLAPKEFAIYDIRFTRSRLIPRLSRCGAAGGKWWQGQGLGFIRYD